jgi:hypothetical protein
MRRAVLLALLAAPAFPAGAAAFEPTGNVVADAFLATLERGGYGEVAARAVSRADGAVVLDGVSATATTPAAPDTGAQTLAIASVRIAGGAVNGDNALVADEIRYEDVRVTEADGTTASSIATVAITAATFPTEAANGAAGVATLLGSFETVALEGIDAAAPDGSTVTVGAIRATVEERDLAIAAAGSFGIDDLVFDISAWDEPAESQMRALGYETLTMDLDGRGRWEAASGRTVVEDVTVAVDDLGTLTLGAAFDGLTETTLADLGANAADFGQLLTLLQTVTLSNLTVSYSDAGLTGRLVTDAAQRAGVPEEALVQGLVATIPDALAILNAPEFTASVTDAARTFLADPGTLRIAIAPGAPVAVAEVIGAALMNPGSIPGLLNLEITAAP